MDRNEDTTGQQGIQEETLDGSQGSPSASRSPEAAALADLFCCHPDCQDLAEWVIYDMGVDPRESDTHSCTAHVGELLSDSREHRIFPISDVDGYPIVASRPVPEAVNPSPSNPQAKAEGGAE